MNQTVNGTATTCRVLIVDPDKSQVQPLIDMLHKAGHKTRRFAKLPSAIQAKNRSFDAAILAWPNGKPQHGEQQLMALQEAFSCPIYLSVPATHAADAANTLTYNIRGYLLRPYILAEIHNWLLHDLATRRILVTKQARLRTASRENRLLKVLNEVAVKINQARSLKAVFSILTENFRSIHLHYIIARLDKAGESLHVSNTSLDQNLIDEIEPLIGANLLGYEIEAKRLGDRANKILRKKSLGFRANAVDDLATLLDFVKLKQVLHKFNFPDRAIYAPLFFDGEVDGIFVIFGDDLVTEDKPIFNIFTYQFSTALTEARLLEELTLHKQVSTQLNSTQNTSEILKLIVRGLTEMLGSKSTASLMVYDRGVKEIQVREVSGIRQRKSLEAPPREKGLTNTAIKRNAPAFSYEKDAPPLHKGAKKDHVTRAMSIPLLDGERVIGALYADSQEGLKFSAHEVGTAQFFANQAVTALRDARYMEQLLGVTKIATQISSEHNIKKLLDLICNKTAEFLDANSSAILLLTEENDQKILRIEGSWGLGERIIRDTRDVLGSSIAGRVAATGLPIIANDIPNDQRFYNPAAIDENFQAIVSVPIKFNEQIVGTLDIHSKSRTNVFTKNDLNILELVANLATVAIENARKMHEVQVTRQIGEELTELFGVQEVMHLFVTRITKLLGEGASAALNVFDPTRQEFQTREVFGPRKQIILDSPPRVNGVAWKVYHDNMPIILEHAFNSPLVQECVREDRVKSLVVVPVLGQQELPIGVLYTDSINEPRLGERLPLLQILANQAGIAIERARLTERMALEKRLVQGIAKATSILSDLQTTWREIILGAMELTGAERGNISQVDDKQNVLKDVVREGSWGEVIHIEQIELSDKKSIQGWVAFNKQSVLIFDVDADDNWKKSYTYFRRAADTQSELAVPILRGGTEELVGIINLESTRNKAFSEDDVHLLESLAVYADIAVQNAQLYDDLQNRVILLEKREKQLLALQESTQVITAGSLDRNKTLQAILEEAAKLTDAYFGTIQEIQGDKLYFKAIYPANKERKLFETVGRWLPLEGNGITVYSARTGEACLEKDVNGSETYLDSGLGVTGSELTVPLFVDGAVWGVLNVEHEEENAFDDDDVQILSALSRLAAIALQIAEQANQLSRTNAVALMGAWGAEIVHDINREVGHIRLILSTLRRTVDLPTTMADRINEIDDHADKLDLPPLPEMPPQPGEIVEFRHAPLADEIIRATLFNLEAEFGQTQAKISIISNLNCANVRAAMHSYWLTRLTYHLVRNAIQAIQAKHEAGTVKISSQADRNMITVSVEDTGTGIQPEIEPLLFTAPVTRPGGQGKGLLLVRYIAEAHGGSAYLADNRIGEGACFTFTILKAKRTTLGEEKH